jgi:hypothetical protein
VESSFAGAGRFNRKIMMNKMSIRFITKNNKKIKIHTIIQKMQGRAIPPLHFFNS